MVDWTDSMEQQFEYYIVDEKTWKDVKLLNNITSCSISRDLDTDTLGSASVSMKDMVGECYIRIYLVTIQNGVKERHPLGTFLLQTPSSSFDGKTNDVTVDGYTPLMELKENQPPIGYALLKDENILQRAIEIVKTNCRIPVIETTSTKLLTGDFVSNTNDTWIKFCIDLLAQANFHFNLDDYGKILFEPDQKIEELQPVYTFDDGNSSILYPELTLKHDIYKIPNVVELTADTPEGQYYTMAINDDPNSPTSTVRRKRRIVYRIEKPNLPGVSTREQLDEYVQKTLSELSSVEYKITFQHGYYPIRIGDCVRLNYKQAGFRDIKAKIISQSISCKPGCTIKETAVFTTKLWK